jgi:hypothetical protein
MVSPRKLAANRQNAARSTGPRTPDGKARSACNASTHRAYCAHLLLPGEPEDFFHALRDATLERLSPQDALELALADRVVAATWRLRRLQTADACLNAMEEADVRDQAQQNNDDRRRVRETLGDDVNADEAAALEPVDLPAGPLNPGHLIARSLRLPLDGPADDHGRRPAGRATASPFERLLTAEQRLQGMLHRALRELRALQADRRQHPDPDPCPFLPPDPDDDDDDDTAPLPDATACNPPQPPATPTELQNEPNLPPHRCPSVPSVATSAPFVSSCLRGSPSPKLQNKPNPKTARALYQAATRAAGDLLPPPKARSNNKYP